jgi:rubrerythrin
MFTAGQFRTKAAEYTAQIGKTAVPSEIREFRRLEQSFLALAQNEDWLANNFEKIIRSQDTEAAESREQIGGRTASEIEEHILRCLGAAVMMHWNTIPTKLRRELFDTAGSMGELLKTAELRGQIARFLHDHKDDDEPLE